MRETALSVAFMLAAALGVTTWQHPLSAAREAAQAYEDIYYLPRNNHLLGALTLGHDEAAADLLWMKALLYYADQLQHAGRGRHLLQFAHAVSHLDPNFRRVYIWGGATPFYTVGHLPDLETGRLAVELLYLGAERLPRDGELAWNASATTRYEFLTLPGELSEDQRAHYERMADHYERRALRLGAAPHWVAAARAADQASMGRSDRAVHYIEQTIRSTRDPELRAQLEEDLRNVRHRQDLLEQVSSARALGDAFREQYPYVPGTLYLLLGERVMPPLDAE